MARTRNSSQGPSSDARNTIGSSRITASGMRLRPRPLLKPPENAIRSPTIRKRKRPATSSRPVHNPLPEPDSRVSSAPPQPLEHSATRTARSRAQAVSTRSRPRPLTPLRIRPQDLPLPTGAGQNAQNSTSDALPLRLVAERSPTPIPTRQRRNGSSIFGSSPTVIRVATARNRLARTGDDDHPGTSASEPDGTVRVRSIRHRDRMPQPPPFLLTLRLEPGTTADRDNHFLDTEDSERLRAFISEHYMEDADDIHREIMRAVRENFEGFRNSLTQQREAQEDQRRRRGEAWLTRFNRPRRGAGGPRYLPRTPCTICFEENPVQPVGCNSCNQLIGCSDCVGRWFGSSNCSELDPHANVGPSDNHSKCPLCRFPWVREPAVFSASCEFPPRD